MQISEVEKVWQALFFSVPFLEGPERGRTVKSRKSMWQDFVSCVVSLGTSFARHPANGCTCSPVEGLQGHHHHLGGEEIKDVPSIRRLACQRLTSWHWFITRQFQMGDSHCLPNTARAI